MSKGHRGRLQNDLEDSALFTPDKNSCIHCYSRVFILFYLNQVIWRYKDRGIYHKYCKFCQAEFNREHYRNDKNDYLERAVKRNARLNSENKEKLKADLVEHPCVDCELTDIRYLEFDHVRSDKTANIFRLLTQGRSWLIIEAEMAKCEIRCANCHRKRTSERDGNWWRTSEIE